jgi:hypothetical protein
VFWQVQKTPFRADEGSRKSPDITPPVQLSFSAGVRPATIAAMKVAWTSLAAACALVIGVYAYLAQPGTFELQNPDPADAYYNLLVRGFRAGQLSLKQDVPVGLTQLADPYDPIVRAQYPGPLGRVLDLSYYKGKLYLYFGITPALLLFWPYAALTGRYLFHRQAVVIFCAIGFVISAGLLRALWHRYFAEVSVWVVAACTVALGLSTIVPPMLPHTDVYEVPIACGYMLTMLALGATWCALHAPQRRCRWLAVASAAYGLAVAARPNLLFGAVILLVPVVHAWHKPPPEGLPRSAWLPSLLAATTPDDSTIRSNSAGTTSCANTSPPQRSSSVCAISGSISASIFWNRRVGVVISPSCNKSPCHLRRRAMGGFRIPSAS